MKKRLAGFPGRGTFAGGVHPEEAKALSAGAAIEVLPVPERVAIPLWQNAGAPCKAVVTPKTEVHPGDKIGDAEAFISAPLHASIAGVVQREGVATLPNGRHVRTVPIKGGGEGGDVQATTEDFFGGEWSREALDDLEPEAIAAAVREAGIVGLGGAAFPTHVKLSRNPDRPVDTLLVNGCECEPYLTADHRLMLEAAEAIVVGALAAARACGAERVIVGVEDNKEDAAASIREAAGGTGVEVAVVETRYPMGGEKQLIRAVLGRVVPTGGLPLDVGVVVLNVGTAAAVARAVLRGGALTHRVVTVTGQGIVRPANLLVPIGARFADLLEFCGGLRPEAVRVVAGGPMMGFSVADLETPVTKGTSGIVVLTAAELRGGEETACVRCGRCVDVCPLNLVPTKIAMASRHEDWELAQKYDINACMECGCCAYTCPARIPLVQLIRMGKARIAAMHAK